MKRDEEISIGLDYVKSRLSDAGLDVEDPIFMKHAKEAPVDIEFDDQIAWAIDRTQEEIESNQVEEEHEEAKHMVSIEEALECVRRERIL